MNQPTYFHGGYPSLKVGEYLLPASETGVRGLDDWSSSNSEDIGQFVYVTTNLPAARLYAALYPGPNGGTVYEVLPEGTLTPDRDCELEGISFSCARALVIAEHPIKYSAVQRLRSTMMRASSSMIGEAAKADATKAAVVAVTGEGAAGEDKEAKEAT